MIQRIPDSRLKRRYAPQPVPGAISRVDAAHLLLPSPNFDASSDDAAIEFLDEAAHCLTRQSLDDRSLATTLRNIYAVLHVRRHQLGLRQWRSLISRCRRHPLMELLHEDVLTWRAFVKPRGYAGDAELLDLMYATEHFWEPPAMSELGQRLHAWTTHSSACRGVKCRRAILAGMIDRLATEIDRPHILSMAAGHLRECEISPAIIRRQLGRIVALDSDEASLEAVDRTYGRFGVQTFHASARELLGGRIEMESFDLIYSSGLCDYLNDTMCQRLAAELFERLNPGGILLLTNFVPEIEGIGYMEAFMDWNLVYRDRVAMMAMTSRIPDRNIAHVYVFAEENDNVLFLQVQRRH